MVIFCSFFLFAFFYAFPFSGCAFHGCSRCYEDGDILPGGKTAAKLRERDAKRLEEIRKEGVTVHVFWECEVGRWLREDAEMRKSYAEYEDEGPIDLHNCFYGGRTEGHCAYYKPKPGEQISYFDVTSLYPYIK